MRRTILSGLALAGALTLAIGIGNASADTISFNLSNPNSGISGFTGPYASVTVNQTSLTTATITFTSLVNGGNTYLMGGAQAVALNVAGSYTLSNVTETGLAGFTVANLGQFQGPTNGGTNNADGFGSFNLTVDNFDGFTHAANQIVVSLTGGNWANAASVLTANTSGFLAASHIFVCANPCTAGAGALGTGYAANGASAVPEPTTLLLLGSGLIGLAWSQRQRFGIPLA